MQVPLKWIQELIDIQDIKLEELIERLTLGGFEVEEILEIKVNDKNQTVLDISATANRSDSLSIQGIATEIASLLNKPLNKSLSTKKILAWNQILVSQQEKLEGDLGCSTFLAFEVKNISNLTSPAWLKEKLISCGIIPNNNLSDFQTYLLLETGYPFAFYDLEKLQNQIQLSKLTFSIEKANDEQEFIASNNLKYTLNSSNSLIKVNNIPISIAGIIENNEYSYSTSTKSLLIEGSIFNAAMIRKQSRNLGIRTDRSARYEKALKHTYLIEASYRLISLLRLNNPNIICKVSTFLQKTEKPLQILTLNYSTIKEILGPINTNTPEVMTFISTEMVNKYLKQLNFKFTYNAEQSIWNVDVPHLRSEDITREIDLIEEIGRLHGFNNFLTTLPKIRNIGNEDFSYQTRKKITRSLLNLGLNELIHYSLVRKNLLTNEINDIDLVNPLVSDYKTLRTSLLPALLETTAENLKQSNRIIEGFEYGHVFSGNIPNNFQETEHIAGVFGGTNKKLAWSTQKQSLTWFEAKGKIEQLFNQLNIKVNWKINNLIFSNSIFHPYRTAELYLENKRVIGTFGQIHPAYANDNGLGSEIYLFEFQLKPIEDQIQQNKLTIFKNYSSYPRIVKDLSFIISKNITFNELTNIIRLNGTKFLSEINLLDEYQNSTIPNNCTSLCLQLIFQSNEKTLETKKIETIIQNLESILTNEFNAIIRQ